MKIKSLIFFLAFSTLLCEAQPSLHFQHINSANGLSGTSVRCIIQDHEGFMWMGTDLGLNRYDAKEIITYRNNPNDSTTISGNKVNKFFEDKNGMLWIATSDGGLCSFDLRTKKIKRFSLQSTRDEMGEINTIFEDTKGRFWIATDQKNLFTFNKMKGTFSKFLFDGFETSGEAIKKIYSYRTITENKNGDLYFGTLAFSLVILHDKKFEWNYNQSGYDIHKPYPAHTINTIFCDQKNNTWIGGWDNVLHKYNPQKKSVENIFIDGTGKINFSGDEINTINEDDHGVLWIGTRNNGLYLYNDSTKKIFNFRHDRLDKQSISSNTIRCIFHDNEGRMWIGTDAGVDVFDPLLNQFEINFLGDKKSSGDNVLVNDFLEEGNKFYVAASNGLWIREDQSQNFSNKIFPYNGEELSITKLFRDHAGTIFIGTNKTAFVFDRQKLQLKTFNTFFKRSADTFFDFYNIPSSRIVSMAESNWQGHDVIWISPIGHGVSVFDKKNLSGFESTFMDTLPVEHMIRKIFTDSKNNVWFLTASHGIAYNPSLKNFPDSIWNLKPTKSKTVLVQQKMLKVKFLKDVIKNFPSEVFDMIENADGSFWITSPGSGLYLMNLNDKKNPLTHFENQYPGMYGIQKDENENLWIVTFTGIEFFDTRKKNFHHFSYADGIPSEGLHGYFYKDGNGNLYAPGNGWFLKFKPEKILFNSHAPSTAVTHFKIFDHVADSLLDGKKIKLSYRENYFSFEFTSLNYTNSSENKFMYKLEGVDPDWVNAGKRNFAGYTNIHGGDYIFKVKSSNNNDVWSKNEFSIPVYIKPPIWQYSFFYPSLILILLAAGIFIYRKRLNRIHAAQTEKLRAEIDAQEKERKRIARDLHDEFGTKMSALKIYLSTLEKHLDSKNEIVQRTKDELYSIVDNSMTDLRSLLMNLSPKTLEMHGFHAAIKDLANRLNSTKLFVIEFYVAEELEKFDKEYELTLYRIAQELINNSIKHSGCTEINIQLIFRDGNLIFNYDDNGKGFEKEILESKGYGLKNIETRISLLKGKVKWDTSPGHGINVTIEIPFSIST